MVRVCSFSSSFSLSSFESGGSFGLFECLRTVDAGSESEEDGNVRSRTTRVPKGFEEEEGRSGNERLWECGHRPGLQFSMSVVIPVYT